MQERRSARYDNSQDKNAYAAQYSRFPPAYQYKNCYT